MSIRRCKTCAKRFRYGKCIVLSSPIGENADCWAWSDDPNWLAKTVVYVRAYENGWRKGPLPEPWAQALLKADAGKDISSILCQLSE